MLNINNNATQYFLICLFSIFLVTYYLAKFPSHYQLDVPVDFSYIFLLFFVTVTVLLRRIPWPKSFALLITFNGCCTIYGVVYTLYVGQIEVAILAEFVEGNTYFTRSAIAWITSPILSFIMMFFIPICLHYISIKSLILTLKIWIFINAYFAIFQTLSLFHPTFFDFLPISIGVPYEGQFNLSFGRAVGITSANGSFYFGLSMIVAGLIINHYKKLSVLTFLLISTCVLSLSRTVIIVFIIFLVFIMMDHKVKFRWYLLCAVITGYLGFLLFSSELWDYRMMFDKSSSIRESQMQRSLQLLSEYPFGIGANIPYFFDGTITALIVKYGVLGPAALLINVLLVAKYLSYNYTKACVIAVIVMYIASLLLIGGPFSYLTGLLSGIFLIRVSQERHVEQDPSSSRSLKYIQSSLKPFQAT